MYTICILLMYVIVLIACVCALVCALGYGLGLVCTTEFMTSYYDLVIKL